jgi:hypothetical protein
MPRDIGLCLSRSVLLAKRAAVTAHERLDAIEKMMPPEP